MDEQNLNNENIGNQQNVYIVRPGSHSKIVAGLFGILLGGLGVHSFYLGFTGKGVAQIIVTVFTLGAGHIWGFIEGILILASLPGTKWHQDAWGQELTD